MRITDLQTFIVGNPWKNWLFVKLATDEGIVGLGEATGGLSTKPNEGDLHELRRFVIGEDPLHPSRIWDRMYKGRFLNTSIAMCAIETACWDILARSLDVPAWQLFGGKRRDTLRVYANGWYQGPRDPGFFAERAAEMVEQGYTALKFDPFGGAYLQIDAASERLSLDIIRAVRDAVGPDVDVLVEGHDRFSVQTAIRLGRKMAEYAPTWFEAPVNARDIQSTLEVARAIEVPVATGEKIRTLATFGDLLAERVIDIIQPEVLGLGIANIRKAFGIIEAYDGLVACHQAQSPFCTAINAHLHASIPNFLVHENFDDNLEPWTWDVLTGVPRVENGHIRVPDTPGFGVELNEDEAAKHPYGERNFLRLFDEGWETRRPPEEG